MSKIIFSIMLEVLIFSSLGIAQSDNEILINEEYYGYKLEKILKDLVTNYVLDIDYNSEDLPKDMLSPKWYKNKTLKYVIDDLLSDLELNYQILDRQVVIRKKGSLITLEEKKYPRKFDFKLSGVVKDKNSGESLPYAQVLVQGTTNGAPTNVDGYFTLFNVPADTSVLEVVYMGYNKKLVQLTPRLLSKPLSVDMTFTATNLEGVTVTAEMEDLIHVSENISTISITPKDISSLPTLGDKDIFRTFQLLPGVSGSNESSAGLYVRGGTPDQNLILYDGFTIYHQEHLFGMYSAFNTNALKDVKLYKGGFESKYGGRLSSVVDIIGKTGNENKFNLGGDISFLSFNGYTEIPLGGKGSIFIAARRSYKGILYNKFFNAFQEDVPASEEASGGRGFRGEESADPTSYFYDINAKATYHLTNKDIISYSFFNGEDDLDNSREISRSRGGNTVTGGMTDLTKWGNWGSSLKWSRKWNDKFYMNNLISYSNYYSTRDRQSSRTTTQEDGTVISNNRGMLEDNDLKDISYKMDNELKTGKNNQLKFGMQLTNYNIDYDYTQNDTLSILNMDDIGNQYAVYLQDNWTPFGRLQILPGLRATYYDITNKFYIEPRLQLSFKLTEKLKLKGAWGIYNQFANRVIREDIMAGSRDFWVLADGDEIPVSESTHYIAGISYETNDYIFDVESYYKDLSGLSEYTLRFAPSYGQLDYSSFFYQGSGFAQGIEILAQKKFGKYTGWIGYTLGQVLYDFPVYGEGYFAAAHDVTHEFKIVNSYKWKKWTFSGTWIFATGKPYTEPLGGYTLDLPDGNTSDYIITGSKNGSRYPNYHRLDLSAKYDFSFGKTSSGSFGCSLFNVYNRSNVWYNEYEIDDSGLTETTVNLLSFTPNLFVSFKIR